MKANKKNILLFLLIFFLGIFFEKFHVKNKLYINFLDIINSSSRFIYSLKSFENLEISIKPKDYNKLVSTREQALNRGILDDEMQKWLDAEFIENKQIRNIKIKLKGTFPDHWQDSKRWSFQLKINDDSKSFNEVRRFNLQPPETASYMYEWLLMKALEKEKLINLETKYYNVTVNGNNLGVYMYQATSSEELLKLNGRKAGPIIGFTKDLFVKEYEASKKLNLLGAVGSLNGIEDSFWRAKIEPVQFPESANEKDKEVLIKAIKNLESFRQGKKKTSEVFDAIQLAKLLAIRASLGSSEFDYRDTKFYFNIETGLLEPISKEAHVDLNLNFKDHYFSWWIDSSDIRPHRPGNKDFFLDLLYNDKKFHSLYLKELNRVTKIKYYENLINTNQQEFEKYLKIQKMNYLFKEVISLDQLETNRLRIQDFLDPVHGINVYFIEEVNNILKFNISNLQRLPIEIVGIEFKDEEKFLLKNSILINGKIPQSPITGKIIEFECNEKNCDKNFVDQYIILYKVLGQEIIKKSKISKYYFK